MKTRQELEDLAFDTNVQNNVSNLVTPPTIRDQYREQALAALNFLDDLLSGTDGFLIAVNPAKDGIVFVDPDSIGSFGTEDQIPSTNAGVDGYDFSDGLKYDGDRLVAKGSGTESTSIGAAGSGSGAVASAQGAIALGRDAAATGATNGANPIAIGSDSDATEGGAIALGRNALASGRGSLVIGRKLTASAAGAIIIGYAESEQINNTANSFVITWDNSIACIITDSKIQIDEVTDLAGTGPPNLPQGLTLGGGSDSLDTYIELDLDISSSGDFSASQTFNVKVTKIGRLVTITTDGSLLHSSTSLALSASGFIPASCRPPSSLVLNAYATEATRISQVGVATDGTFRLDYRDWAGASTAKGSSGGAVTITYAV